MARTDIVLAIGQAVERRYPGSREHVMTAGTVADQLGFGDAYAELWATALGIPIPEVEPPPEPPIEEKVEAK
jgi:hypothetical protein